MGAKVYDTTLGAFVDADTPLINGGGVFSESEGKVYNGSEWVDAWSANSYKYVMQNGQPKDFGSFEYVTSILTPGGNTWTGIIVVGSTYYDYTNTSATIEWTLEGTITGASADYHIGKFYISDSGTSYWDNTYPNNSDVRRCPVNLVNEDTPLYYAWGSKQLLPAGRYKIGFGIFNSANISNVSHSAVQNGILLHAAVAGSTSVDVTVRTIMIKDV